MAAKKGVKVYNADEVTIVFGASILDSGFADGEFLRVEQDTDDTEDFVGTDGEVTISRTNDRRATMTVVLMQTSSGNDEMTVYSNLTRNSPNFTGAILPMAVKDQNGRTLHEGTHCWVAKAPDRSFDRGPQRVEWKIRVAHLDRVDGGNNDAIA